VNTDEAYRILRLKKGADLEEVKKSFRSMAFSLHPDLNPDNPHAGRHFQRVNEAYVLLKKQLEAEEPAAKARPERERAKRAERAKRPEPEPPPKQEKPRKERADARAKKPGRTARPSRPSREEVMQDILRDPFARQVFSDIYNQIRQRGGPTQDVATTTRRKRKLQLDWGESRLSIDLSDGVMAGIRSWVKGWMDEEQTVYLPYTSLRPGAKVRLQVRQGWTGKPTAVDVTLPVDYVPGRPIRLRGLGRKLGPWKGDLYVRLLAK
jgi:molecular chaperone DnaJ